MYLKIMIEQLQIFYKKAYHCIYTANIEAFHPIVQQILSLQKSKFLLLNLFFSNH